MQISIGITIDPKNPNAALAELKQLIALLDQSPSVEPASEAPKKKRMAKLNPSMEDLMVAAVEKDDSFSLDAEEEETPAVATKADMLAALRAHPNKERVAKLLQTQFKVKNINELSEAQYGEVIAAVKTLK